MAKPAAADATCGTLNSGHCYGEDAWNSAPQNEGIYATENVSCMYIPDPGSDFVTEEIWNGTDNSNQGGEKWVELGMEEGLTTTGRGFFWANENLNAPPNDPFVHNIGGSPSLNTNYSLLIEWTGGQNWAVDINGYNYGVAADNPIYGESMAGGSERTTETSRLAASFSSLGWYNSSGLGENYWSGSGIVNKGGGTVSVPGPPQSSFSNYYDGTGSCSGNAVPAQSAGSPAEALGAVPAPEPVPSSTVSASESTSLLEATQSFASLFGDPTPGTVVVVPTTRSAANQLMGAGQVNNANGQPDATGVYLVQASGTFAGSHVPMPGDQTAAGGSYVWFTLDPTTNQILDWHLSPTPLSNSQLTTLGTVSSLGRAASLRFASNRRIRLS